MWGHCHQFAISWVYSHMASTRGVLLRSYGPPRGRVGAEVLKPHLVALMRFVALVGVVAVACLHAGVWALSRDVVGAPSFRGQLASVSYNPFDGCASDRGQEPALHARADPRRPEGDRALHPDGPHLFVHRRRRAVPEIAQEFGLAGFARRLARQGRRAQRARNPSVIELARKHRNIDSIVVGNETIYRNEQIPLPNLRLNEQDAENLLREEAQRHQRGADRRPTRNGRQTRTMSAG